MMPPPLAIVQARWGSTRLPGKMGKDLGGYPLVWWAWNAAVVAFGWEHVVCAIPANKENDVLNGVLLGMDMGRPWPARNVQIFRWDGPESDVLGRVHDCAHAYRWHPDSVILRVTPDDPWKVPAVMQLVAMGERHPVEIGGEAFTLGMLDEAYYISDEREHLTHAIPNLVGPPPAPAGTWTVDTPEDLEACRELLAKNKHGMSGDALFLHGYQA